MPPFLVAAYALSLVLIPVDLDKLESAELDSCEKLRSTLEKRGISATYESERLIFISTQLFDRETNFAYVCHDGQVVLQSLVARTPKKEQAIAFYERLRKEIESELGPATKTGQDPLEPACLLEKAGLANLGQYNTSWLLGGNQVIAIVFEPAPGSTEWPVGTMVRSRDAPDCGFQLDWGTR